MKIAKKILLGILGVIVLVLVIGIFIKKDYSSEREVVINKPLSEVFDYIKFLKNQNNYSVWALRDPNAQMEYHGEDGTVGFVSCWNSTHKHVGVGEQEIKTIVPNQRIDYELRFKKPMESTDYAYMITESVSPNQTKVKWGFNGKMCYPMNLMMPFMNMDKMLGGDLQTGLDNLKMILEK